MIDWVLLSQNNKVRGTRDNLCTGHRAFEFLIVPFSLIDAIVTFSVPMNQVFQDYLDNSTMAYLDEIVTRNPTGEELKDYLQKVVFDGLNEAKTEGPILEVYNATKPFKVEIERFNYMLEEYLHHFVDDRQRNWVQLLNVAQFSYNAQTNLSTRRSQFEIDGSRHSVLLPLIDRPYVRNNP
ncbi:RNA-directed DNA polymerase-like protein [Cucumis melo var. makuwa]|uniref:RNA-directed DNA polymerase-like protein n=1 Tax=Cucumis melo var. makuwa TaxID=1194695 RepID=A0A5D3E412_CUCMM|nr:RNA-directed DNA polymerase-like protein [Cucumis melo var. makuwa]